MPPVKWRMARARGVPILEGGRVPSLVKKVKLGHVSRLDRRPLPRARCVFIIPRAAMERYTASSWNSRSWRRCTPGCRRHDRLVRRPEPRRRGRGSSARGRVGGFGKPASEALEALAPLRASLTLAVPDGETRGTVTLRVSLPREYPGSPPRSR